MEPFVSVIIPTYKRAYTLKYVLEGLKKQTYKAFEVIAVVVSEDIETEEILRKYSENLFIKKVIQREGKYLKALQLGVYAASSEIIVLLDDDAIPLSNWLEECLKTYKNHQRVGCVSGKASSVKLRDGKFIQIANSYTKWLFPWSRPIAGMSGWFIFYGKDGLPHTNPECALIKNLKGVMPSLLLMGANMSVKREAVELKGILKFLEDNFVLGFAWEQFLSYMIWRQGFQALHNPRAQVLHIIHSESMARFFRTPGRAALREAEYVLSFFLLKSLEKEVSWTAYILRLFELLISRALSARKYGHFFIYRIYGILYGFVIGCAFTISTAFKGKFSIKNSLSKLKGY